MTEAAPVTWHSASITPPNSGLRRTGFMLLGYTVFVLLFGALVRVTGSGAGCGQHWPTCQGEVVHLPQSLETVLELSHRLTSGVLLIAALAYGFALWRRLPRGHRAKRAMVLGIGFTLVDALIGAVLVLGSLVGENTSIARALVMPAHLISTCGLSAGFALAAYWAEQPLGYEKASAGPATRYALAALLAGFVLVSAMGAVTALGDTLYPVEAATMTALADAQSGTAHFLERLRVVHPLLAVAFALLVARLVPRLAQSANHAARRFARASVALVLGQLGLGLVNVWLGAPGWMQIVHLAFAIALWLALVFTTTEVLAPSAKPS